MTAVIRRMSVEELHELIEKRAAGHDPLVLIDVREPYEFESGHVDGAVNIPLGELPFYLHEIPRDSQPIFICQVGGRSLAACQMALQAGVGTAANVEGGMTVWQQKYGS